MSKEETIIMVPPHLQAEVPQGAYLEIDVYDWLRAHGKPMYLMEAALKAKYPNDRAYTEIVHRYFKPFGIERALTISYDGMYAGPVITPQNMFTGSLMLEVVTLGEDAIYVLVTGSSGYVLPMKEIEVFKWEGDIDLLFAVWPDVLHRCDHSPLTLMSGHEFMDESTLDRYTVEDLWDEEGEALRCPHCQGEMYVILPINR